ncbi:Diaminopimelate epimerase [bacterium HR40]|nr:Diaminopimelate epimerase [bacterium HR40]
METRSFVKMQGCGNDFAIFDGRDRPLVLHPELVRRLADRRRGIGFDQLILLERDERAAAFVRFFNADGSESGACGNGTRCVARLLADELGCRALTLATRAGLLPCRVHAPDRVEVEMPEPRLRWNEIPLARPLDTLAIELGPEGLPPAVAVSMGNPHAVLFVDDLDRTDVARLGAELEHHPLFPERVNVGFAQLLAPGRLRLRVFERGSGLTPACGSGACAALVAAVRRGIVRDRATLILDGGELEVFWAGAGPVHMIGPAAYCYRGILEPLHPEPL